MIHTLATHSCEVHSGLIAPIQSIQPAHGAIAICSEVVYVIDFPWYAIQGYKQYKEIWGDYH